MEPRFGQDFSGVRVHTDAQAAASAGAVRARAYTVGSHIAFASGAYSPATSGGLRLLAHELTHTVQQKGGGGGGLATQLEVGDVDDPTEHEADHIADQVMKTPTEAVPNDGLPPGTRSVATAGVSPMRGAAVAPAIVALAKDSLDRTPTLTVQRDAVPGSAGPAAADPLPQTMAGAPPGVDAASGPAPAGQAVPAGAPAGTCPPGYTICDFLNEHISLQGQYALNRLYQRGGAECHHAIQILSAVRSGQVQGVYKADEGKPAMLAQRNGTGWWSLQDHPSAVPKGGAAFVFEGESPPMVVFKKEIADDREGLATALNNAWNASAIGATELNPSPPSGKSCEPAIKQEKPPPEPEPPKQEAECEPGLERTPTGDCVIPGMTLVHPCTDKEMFSVFQSAQDECAHYKMAIEGLCKLPHSKCDLIPEPLLRALCKMRDPDEECNKPTPQFYADCTFAYIKTMQPTMRCDLGSAAEIFDQYKRWPDRR
jgi:hypothetical protein